MGTLLLSRRSWSVHLVRGRPGGRFHVGSGGRPTDSSTWRSMAWCAGMLYGNLAEYGIATSGNSARHSTSVNCKAYATLFLPNFQVHQHTKMIPFATQKATLAPSSGSHSPQHEVYESSRPREVYETSHYPLGKQCPCD